MFGLKKKPATEGPATAEPMVPRTRRRPLLVRLFSLKFWGAVRLTLLCVAVGVLQRLSQTAQNPQEIAVWETIKQIWQNTFAALIWAFQHGWQPALAGAVIVLPIWVIWRLVSLPFRR